MTTHRLVVGSSPPARLDLWLVEQLPQFSRARLQGLIENGAVLIDGVAIRRSSRPKAGQVIEIRVPEVEPAEPVPEDIPIPFLYEDADLIAVDKPAGLVVHPGSGIRGGTLVNALLHHVKDLSGIGGVARPGIVHRLDRGTSGVMLVAKNDAAHHGLTQQFANRSVEKEYAAVVLGHPSPPSGRIAATIGRDPVHRQRMSVKNPRGRAALSTYRVEERLRGTAYVRVQIHTGRTHQVRVHMASIGYPLVGDKTYGGRRIPASLDDATRAILEAFPRPALHSTRIVFDHPRTGERLTVESPLPQDLQQLLTALRPTK